MNSERGRSLSDRLAQTRGRETPCPIRHVWVADAADKSGVKRPGLLIEWRRAAGGGWEGLVMYAAELRPGQWAVVQEWLGGALVTQA
jgi:hypothetical protein